MPLAQWCGWPVPSPIWSEGIGPLSAWVMVCLSDYVSTATSLTQIATSCCQARLAESGHRTNPLVREESGHIAQLERDGVTRDGEKAHMFSLKKSARSLP